MFAKIENNQIVSVQPQTMCMFNIPFSGKMSLQELKILGILPVREVMESCSQYQEPVLKEYIIKEDEVEAHYDVVGKDPTIVRKMKENEAHVIFKESRVNVTDKAISNLQAYILADIPSVSWKCDNGLFITLSGDEFGVLLTQLMAKRAELYNEENQ